MEKNTAQQPAGRKRCIDRYANGIHYQYEFEEDGWISIYEVVYGRPRRPVIQACSIEKADSYIAMIEPVTVPMTPLC